MFIIGEGTCAQLNWVNENFDRLAQGIGPDAVVVQGHDNQLTKEVVGLVRKYSNNESDAILFQGLFLFVSEGHPQTTMKQVCAFPLTAVGETSEVSIEFMAEIVDRVVDAVNSNTFSELVAEKSPDTYSMHYGGGLTFKFVKRLNEILELKPNIAGFGINFNEMIEAKIKSYERVVD